MADNVLIPLTGAGDSTADVATDDAGADGHVQIIKLAISTDGTATLIPANASDGLLVNLGGNNDVTITGVATASNQTDKSQFTKLTDGTDTALITASGEQNVLATAQPGVDIGDVTINNASIAVTGTFWQATQPVSYATTGSGTATGALRVELPTNGTGTVGLNAGSNAIGKLAANSGVDIGDVDITSVVPGTGATSLGKAQDSVAGATDTGIANLIKRIDTPATVTPAAGDYMLQLGDKYGNTWMAQGAFEIATPFNTIENDVDISVKASAGYLKSLTVSNYNAAKRYIQIHNKATAPANPDVPVFSFPIPAGTANDPSVVSFGREDWGDAGYYCSTGIAVGVSTTAGTFTAATTTDHVVAGAYV